LAFIAVGLIGSIASNCGAIAIGHPVGASGARVLVTLLHEMQKRDAKKGLATLIPLPCPCRKPNRADN